MSTSMTSQSHHARGFVAQWPHTLMNRAKRPWVLLTALAVWLAFLAWLRPLTLPDEGRYAGVAWDMLRSGSLTVPLMDGMPYFHKPPLYYWLAEAAFSIFGVNAWAARLPSLLAAWMALAGMYGFVRRYRDAGSATITVLILATLPFYYGGAQFANLDMLVAAMITLCVLAGASTVLMADGGQRHRLMVLAAALFAALAVLAKGLIGVVLPAAILFLWVARSRRWHALRALLWPPAIGLFILVVVPWFWLMQERYPGFFHYFFIYQQFQRFAEGGFNNVQPFWFYPPVIAGLALPWSLWGGGMLRKVFWAAGPAQDLRRLMAIWLVVVVGFFSIPSSKLIGYVLPALPALAFLLAEVVVAAQRGQVHGLQRRLMQVSLGAAAAICLAALGAATLNARSNSMALGSAIRAEMHPGDTLVSLHAYPFDLPMRADAHSPMWVVDDWKNPEVPVRDNWRKELYDAANFDPRTGAKVLVSAAELNARLCNAAAGKRYWIYGDRDDALRYVALYKRAPRFADVKFLVWLLQPDDAFKLRVCGGTPKGGSQ